MSLNLCFRCSGVCSLVLFLTTAISTAHAKTFDDRAQEILDYHVTNEPTPGGLFSKHAFWYAQAEFKAGNTAAGQQLVQDALNHQITDEGQETFRYWAMIECYLRWKSLYTQSLIDQVRNQMTTYTHYDGGSTENHRLMLAAARYLAAQEWPGDTFSQDFTPTDPTGENHLRTKIDLYTRKGTVEFDSPTYISLYYSPFRSIADLANNADLSNKAAICAELLLVDAAGEWLNGHWVSSSLRFTSEFHGQNQYKEGRQLLWLFFGGPDPAVPFRVDGAERAVVSVQAAVSDYRMPLVIQKMANDRSQAFVHHETDTWGGRLYQKTSFLNKTYGMFSQFEEHPTGFGWAAQMQRWAVLWESPAGISTCWIKHPHPDSNSRGATIYEEVLQQKGALIGVYKIPTSDLKQYIRGRIPVPQSNGTQIDNSSGGYMFHHYGSVMIAVYITAGYNWNIGQDSFQLSTNEAGLIIETALPSDYPGSTATQQLQNFRTAFINNNTSTFNGGTNPEFTYTSLAGDVLNIRYNTHRKVNGQTVNYTDWPLFDNPWLYQEYDGRYCELRYDDEIRSYDLDNYTVTSRFIESGGQLVLEAENFDASSMRSDPQGLTWRVKDSTGGFEGVAYVDTPDNNGSGANWSNGCGLDYNFSITTSGPYNIWLRRYAKNGSDNSARIGVNGSFVAEENTNSNFNQWAWKSYGSIALSAGNHTLNLRRREDGLRVDKIVLKKSSGAPSNNLAESAKGTAAAHFLRENIWIEAESAEGQSLFAPLAIQGDSNASQTEYIVVPQGTGNGSNPPSNSDDGQALYTFALKEASNLYVWLRVFSPSGSDDSFWIQLDSSGQGWDDVQFGTRNTWTWMRYKNPNNLSYANVPAGTHTLRLQHREDGTLLDKILITTDPNFDPETNTTTPGSGGGSSSSSSSSSSGDLSSGAYFIKGKAAGYFFNH